MSESTTRIAFQDAMEGADGVLVSITSRPVTLQPAIAVGRYYRFGPGNPIVRLKAMSPDAWRRIYTFETADGTEVPYETETLMQRMKSGSLEEIRPLICPVARMHDVLLSILAHAAYCHAVTLDDETGLSRPDRARVARDADHGRRLLAVLKSPPQGRAGLAAIEAAITAALVHEAETLRAYESRAKPPATKVRRHRDIVTSIEVARAALSMPRNAHPERSLIRLQDALARAETVPAPR